MNPSLTAADAEIPFAALVFLGEGLARHAPIRVRESATLRPRFETEYNSRGVISRNPAAGGDLERGEAAMYERMASAIATRWIRTAAMLRRMAQAARAEAAEEDASSEELRDDLFGLGSGDTSRRVGGCSEPRVGARRAPLGAAERCITGSPPGSRAAVLVMSRRGGIKIPDRRYLAPPGDPADFMAFFSARSMARAFKEVLGVSPRPTGLVAVPATLL
jgi:hypothetical protein